MRTRQANRGEMDTETAQTIAAEALAFLAEEPARIRGFFLASGLEPGDVRARTDAPELLLAVLEHLARDESLLLVFAASRQVAARSIGQAIAALQARNP
jgi:hypothetical protein